MSVLLLLSCGDKMRCWTITIEAFGLTEERLFWGTVDDVTAEAQMLRDISRQRGVDAAVYYSPADKAKSDCQK